MRRIFHALFLVSICTSALNAQIYVGDVKLTLGSSRESTLVRLRSHYRVDSMPSQDHWMVISGSAPSNSIIGTVSFRRGLLARVTRVWTPSGAARTQTDAVRAVIGALQQLLSDRRAACQLTDRSNRAPTGELLEVTVTCNDRQVAIALVRQDGHEMIAITELLGPESLTP